MIAVILSAGAAVLLAACAPAAPAAVGPSKAPSGPGATVSVLYAGSLVGLQEKVMGPGFQAALGVRYQGEGRGSVAAVIAIRDRLRTPDVFISADPEVNLMGPANGNSADWYFTFATTRLVIAYNPRSRFAPELEQARDGRVPWHEVLTKPGFRLGRTDPNLDPKGYRMLMAMELAERVAHLPGLRSRLLGGDTNVAQVFPEEQLLTLLEAGQLDGIAAYAVEASARNLAWIELPPEINLGDPALGAAYQMATFTQSDGTVRRGAPILYTITILKNAPNGDGAIAFLQFVLSPKGRALHRTNGLDPAPVLAAGDPAAVPPELAHFVEGPYAP